MTQEIGTSCYWCGHDGMYVLDGNGTRRVDRVVIGVDRGVDLGTAVTWPDGTVQVLPPKQQ